MRSAIVKVIDELTLVVMNVNRVKADTIWKSDACSFVFAVFCLLFVDLLEHAALWDCQDNLMTKSHELDRVAIGLQLGGNVDISVALKADLGICHDLFDSVTGICTLFLSMLN